MLSRHVEVGRKKVHNKLYEKIVEILTVFRKTAEDGLKPPMRLCDSGVNIAATVEPAAAPPFSCSIVL